MRPPKTAPPPLSVIAPNIAAPIILKIIPSKQPLSEEELELDELGIVGLFADALFIVDA